MYLAWLGGQSGRFRDRRIAVRFNSHEQQTVHLKLVDLLQDGGLEDVTPARLLRNSHTQNAGMTLALVVFEIHSCYSGVLAKLNFEQSYAMKLAQCDSKACFLKIVDVAELVVPQAATHKGPSFPKFVAFELLPELIQDLLASPVQGHMGTVQDVLQAWRVKFGLADGAPPASFLQIPCHIAQLIAGGCWEYLCIGAHAKFQIDCDLYPLRAEIQRRLAAATVGGGDDLLSETARVIARDGLVRGGMMRQIADSLVEWTPDILGSAGDDDDRAGRRMRLESMVAWLRCADDMADSTCLLESRIERRQFGEWNEDLCQFVAYRTGFLLECLILSFDLRSASTLSSSLQHAVRTLPPAWSSSLKALLHGSHSMPAPATMSRARLYVDVGFMLYKQAYFSRLLGERQLPVVYGLVDSSPQGGRNWELTQIDYIAGADLLECVDFARQLALHEVDSLEECPEHERLRSRVAALISRHVLPPTALGTRKAGLASKLHAVCHSIRLECPDWHTASQFCKSFCSLTSDMGTEMDLNAVQGLDVSSAFPYWCSVHMQADDDDDIGGASELGTRMSFAGSLYIPGFLVGWMVSKHVQRTSISN